MTSALNILSAEDIASRLDRPKRDGKGGYSACCPAHDDSSPSLSISDGDNGKPVVYCHAGCPQEAVIDALKARGAWYTQSAAARAATVKPAKKIEPAKKEPLGRFVCAYDYRRVDGHLLFQVCRYEEPKTFRQRVRNSDGSFTWSLKSLKQLVPYRAPELSVADPKKFVFLVEGEKDADNLAALGVNVTTFAGGAGKWRTEYGDYFIGRKVCIIPDNDNPGRAGAELIARALADYASEVITLELPGLPEHGDVSDWLLQPGNDKQRLAELVRSAVADKAAKPAEPPPIPVVAAQSPAPATSSVSSMPAREIFIHWHDILDNGKPLSTIRNLKLLMDEYQITCRYNVISKRTMITIPGSQYTTDNCDNSALAELRSIASSHRLPCGDLEEYAAYIADQNPYNPVADWIGSRPWDGIDRIPSLAISLDPADMPLTVTLLTKWLVAGVAAALSPNGVNAGGVLVLQGAQYAGKTSWFWSLTGRNREIAREGVTINPADRDSIAQALESWLVELGELGSTFRKSDISALKAFLTRDFDVLRRAYARAESRYPRRTVFLATVNEEQFLHDQTGNRRFWSVTCGSKLNPHHGIDMQQVWAQAAVLRQGGMSHLLTLEENMQLAAYNITHTTIDPIEDLILAAYEWRAPEHLKYAEWKTATQVLIEVGYEKPNMKQKMTAADALKNTRCQTKRLSGLKYYLVPMRKQTMSGSGID